MNKVKLQTKLHEAIEEQFEGNTNKLCAYLDAFSKNESTVIMRDGKRYKISLNIIEDKLSDSELVELLEAEISFIETKVKDCPANLEMRIELADRRNELMSLKTKLHYKSLSTSNNN